MATIEKLAKANACRESSSRTSASLRLPDLPCRSSRIRSGTVIDERDERATPEVDHPVARQRQVRDGWLNTNGSATKLAVRIACSRNTYRVELQQLWPERRQDRETANVESLSAYARQFLSMMEKPDVDHIDGLSPAISIEQKTTSHNPRSTVGTVTEIYDYLRLLFARVGTPYCPATRPADRSQTVSQMVDRVMALPEGRALMLLAPMVRGRKGEYRKELIAELQRRVSSARQGRRRDLRHRRAPALDICASKHDIEVVVDRLVVKDDLQTRLADSFETALELADGIGKIAVDADSERTKTLLRRFACPVCGFTIDRTRAAAVLVQQPFRRLPDLRRPRHEAVLRPGWWCPTTAVAGRRRDRGWDRKTPYYYQNAQSLAKHYDFDIETPWASCRSCRKSMLYGSGKEKSSSSSTRRARGYAARAGSKPFEGVICRTSSAATARPNRLSWVREELGEVPWRRRPCPACNGTA